MMVQGKGTTVASDVELGDTMWVNGKGAFRLGTVRAIDEGGQPQHVRLVLTESGTIVVNNVVASSMESTGSSVAKHLLDIGQEVGGQAGAQVARWLTYAVGTLVTGGDAQQASAVPAAV